MADFVALHDTAASNQRKIARGDRNPITVVHAEKDHKENNLTKYTCCGILEWQNNPTMEAEEASNGVLGVNNIVRRTSAAKQNVNTPSEATMSQ